MPRLNRATHLAHALTVPRIMEAMQEGVVITDARSNILAVNSAFSRVTGYSREYALGKNPRFIQSGRHDRGFYQRMWNSLKRSGEWQGEIWNRRKNGEIYPEWLSIGSVRSQDGRVLNYVGVFSDITQRKLSEDRLSSLAHHDPLTGLANRLLLKDRLHQSLAQAHRHNLQLAVVFIDLDGFKPINDQWGHAAGDQVLIETAKRLTRKTRTSDTVARVGGDEFVEVLSGVTERGAVTTARKILHNLSRPYRIPGRQVRLTVSIGIALYPRHGREAERLIKVADQSMYRAKREGGNRFEVAMQSSRVSRFRVGREEK